MVMTVVEIKNGKDLSPTELKEINYWRKKEFQAKTDWSKSVNQPHHQDIIFLLKDANKLQAFGRLRPITVYVNKKGYDIWGIATVVSISRGVGYGRMIMKEMKKYIKSHLKTSIGFCGKYNSPFYTKCGFSIIKEGNKNFIYVDKKGKKHQGNPDDVLYIKGNDDLIDQSLSNKSIQVLHYIPHW